MLANPALAAITGYSVPELTGRPLAELAASSALSEELERVVNGGETSAAAPIEAEIVTRGGARRAVRMSLVALPNTGEPQEAKLLAYVEDVTQQRTLEREVLEAANREQARFGSDLHDGLGQELTGLSLLIKSLSSTLKRGQPVRPVQLAELSKIVTRAIETTRGMARGLSPVGLEGDGFEVAIRSLAAHAEQLYGLKIRVRRHGAGSAEPPVSAAHHLYRICQEALTNAARHGEARQVQIALSSSRAGFSLSVRDDGIGFDPARAADGMGLKLMLYRARLIGAELTFESTPGAGARVVCRLARATP